MDAPSPTSDRFVVLCLRCERRVLARDEWIGKDVRCPHCSAILRVPPRAPDNRPVLSGAPSIAPRRNFTFSCQRCGCMLEGHTGMSGQEGVCPTCAARFVVPQVTATGMPEVATLLDDDQSDPTPLHLYAGAGHQAPQLHRRPDGEMEIECPRCHARGPVDANSCRACGAPFTLDGAPTVQKMRSEDRSMAALVLGVVALPFFWLVIPGVLAIILGTMSLAANGRQPALGRAIAGILLGAAGLGLAIVVYL